MEEPVSKKHYGKRYLLGNIIAMLLFLIVLGVSVAYSISLYTHHGEIVIVPKIIYKNINDANHILLDRSLTLEVQDTGYVKHLPPGCILEQSISVGEKVKPGRTIYVTINSANTPTRTLPDIIDNSSIREAIVKLRSMGFKVGKPLYISGEKDWVYGILVNGKHVVYGDKIPIDATIIIEVGNGQRDDKDSVSYIDPIYPEEDSEEDEFVEINPSEENEREVTLEKIKK